jgi:hypothetical protein
VRFGLLDITSPIDLSTSVGSRCVLPVLFGYHAQVGNDGWCPACACFFVWSDPAVFVLEVSSGWWHQWRGGCELWQAVSCGAVSVVVCV